MSFGDCINSLFAGSTEKEFHETLDRFWSRYTNFNQNNDPFDSNEFICNSKDINDGNSHLWHQKYSLPSTKVLGFVACRVTSKMLGIGSAERSWGDVKTIKSGKRSALGSDISEKQSIVYTSACIEEARIGRNLYHIDSKDVSHSHSWNCEDHAFGYQLYQWGVEKLFQNSDEEITRELKMYIEYRETLHIKSKIQVSKAMFIAKYGSLDLYDEYLKERFIIYHEQLEFDKTDGWNLIGIPEKEDGTLSDHEYFCIHDDLFDRIKSTHQDQMFLWKFSFNELNEDESQSEATETHNENIQK